METRTCSKCFLEKSLNEFRWRNVKKKRRHSFCKSCHSAYRRSHYLANKAKYISKAKKWNGKHTVLLREFITSYLEKHPCVDCGEADIRVLDFDHESDKLMGVCQMIRDCYSLKKIQLEIEKCSVRCANCHRKKTFSEGNYWRNNMGA